MLTKEPALIIGAVTAIIGLLVAFGAPITEDQRNAIIACVTALLPVVLLIRSLVVAPATVEEKYELKPGVPVSEAAEVFGHKLT